MSVFVWGSNKHQQLVGQKGLHCYSPALVADRFEDQIPIQVAAGDDHVLVLCESGDVFAFGGGKDGQLGQGTRFAHAKTQNKVIGLENETVIHIAAGAHSSFAVSAAGSVYHWGLVHVDDTALDEPAVQGGQLAGLAQDQGVVIQPEVDSRRERAEAAARSGSSKVIRNAQNDGGTRYLRDIVRESTERWMLPTEDAEQEYHEELRAMGYHIDEVEEIIASRDEEHLDMLRMVCRRQVMPLPTRIPSLERMRINSISAGYAHVLALSEDGRLYAAGYNDRGQLGLGHRINTSAFKHVDVLKNKFVLQVSCGQQHNICRAVDRSLMDDSVFIGSKVGADAFVWGNGILGQLGLGRRGTTKGRMLPTLVPKLHSLFPLGIADVAAGANFTAAVTITGDVFSFGHAEYNQHGTGNQSHYDYVDPYHFFEPRKVDIKAPAAAKGKQEDVQIVSLTCGSVFTLAVDSHGNLFSWGWNESGVLGHGFSHFSSSPQRVDGIGAYVTGCKVAQVSCGSKHVIALAKHQGAPWATAYRQIMQEPRYYDCLLVAEGLVLRGPLAQGPVRLPCHRALLSARSSYLGGFLRAALSEEVEDSFAEQTVELRFSGAHFNAVTLRCLLDYLYLDRVSAPAHKRKELVDVADELLLPGLRECVLHSNSSAISLSSDFLRNVEAMLGEPEHADVQFIASREAVCASQEGGDAQNGWTMLGHRFVLSRIPYFNTFFSGSFADCNQYVEVDGRTLLRIDISGLLLDGIDLLTFCNLLRHAYRGCTKGSEHEEDVSVNEAMSLLVAANRLGFGSLAQSCERLISLSLRLGTEEDLSNVLAFAQQFNLFRMERQCADLLHLVQQTACKGPRK